MWLLYDNVRDFKGLNNFEKSIKKTVKDVISPLS